MRPFIWLLALALMLGNSSASAGYMRTCFEYFSKWKSNPDRDFSPQSTSGDNRFVKDNWVYVPIVGDVHGRLDRFLYLISSLQKDLQVRFPLILQAGDLGINQDPRRYTRWSQKNRQEINDFYFGDEGIADLYMNQMSGWERVEGKIVVVRGNHDYFIDEYLQARSLVSFGKQFYLLPDGVVESIPLAYDNSLVVGALGGIEMEANSHYSGQENYANPSLSLEALHRLRHQSSTREIDVLLTHQGPTVEFKGSEQIDNLITSLQPSFHFHGHSHYIMNRVNQIGPTQTFGVANLPYEGPICLDSSLCYSLLRFNLKSRKLERWR